MVGFLLEMLRVVLLMMIMGAAMSALFKQVYLFLGFSGVNGYLIGIAIFLWLFVMYRNKWQFAGWYKGKKREKLPRRISFALLVCSALLIILAPFLGAVPQ